MPGDDRDRVAGIRRDGGGGRDGGEGDGRADDGAGDGDGEDVDQPGGVDGHLALAELAEGGAEGEHVVARDGLGDALGRHEAAGGRASGVEPEEGEDGDGAARADDLDEVLAPVVGVSSGDDGRGGPAGRRG